MSSEGREQEIQFSTHALDALRDRIVSIDDVLWVLDNPIFSRRSYAHCDAVYGVTASGLTLKVVVIRGSRPPFVRTLMRFGPERLERLMKR